MNFRRARTAFFSYDGSAMRYIVFAIVYGLGLYVAATTAAASPFFGVLTLGFLVGAPIGIGFLVARGLRSAHPLVATFAPWIPIAIIIAVLLLTGMEGMICVVMALPLMLGGALAGGLLAHLRRARASRNDLGAVLLLPIALMPIESRLTPTDRASTTESSIVIASTPTRVWDEIASVDTIRAEERGRALYTSIGFPAPLAATLDIAQEGGVRRASFEHGVLFIETITDWEPERFLAFAIDPVFDETAPALDPHVRIGGEFFDVLEGSYTIEPIDSMQVRLVLRSQHRVRTRFNTYAGWWADRIMSSVQGEILRVIKARAERTDRAPKVAIRAATVARLARERADVRSANSLDVGFSVVGVLDGRTDVYRDSVVVLVRDGALRAQRLETEQTLDSVTASLAFTSGASWSEGPASNALVLELPNTEGQQIALGPMRRFTIARSAGESLEGRWVVFTFYLTVPKTAENPYGTAWTYAHARTPLGAR